MAQLTVKLIGLQELAQLVCVHDATVWRWIRERRLNSRKMGRLRMIEVDEKFEKWLGIRAHEIK